MKAVLREGALLQIIKGSQIKNLLIQLKALERSKKKAQPKITWQREIIEIREEKTEEIQKINETKTSLKRWIRLADF